MRLTRTFLMALSTAGALAVSPFFHAAEDEPADAVRLSLNECLTRALEQNLDLAIAKKDPKIAESNVTFQKAAFDPILGIGLQHAASRQQSTQVFNFVPPFLQTSESRYIVDQINPGLSQKLFFGATYAVTGHYGTTPSRSGGANSSGGQTVSQADYGRAENWWYSINFTLPLLKGFGKEANEAGLLVAKHNLAVSQQELERRADLVAKAAMDAYWDLRAAREAEKVAAQALQLAQELYELNRKKVEVGTLAPIEITQAEANVASNVEGTIRTKVAVKNAEDNLRRLLAVPPDDPLWTRTILPTEKPMSEAATINLDEAMSTAMERRREIASAKEQVAIADVDEAAAHNGVKHQLDLVADWRRTHDETPTTITILPPSPSAGTYPFNPVSRTSPDWSVELRYTYPFGNRAAKSNYAVAKLNSEKSQLTLEGVVQDVRVDVRTAVRAVESGFERVTAARKNVELQQKKLDAEQKKFDNGMSTSFEVFTFQTDLRNAQLSLIQALLDYNKALADLERAKGTLMESQGLKLAADAGR